jgi:hypothetical protein
MARLTDEERQALADAKWEADCLEHEARLARRQPSGSSTELKPAKADKPAPNRRGDGFVAHKLAWIEQMTLDDGLSRGALRVGLRLASYLNRLSGEAWPAQVTLAKELGMADRSVRYGVDELIKRGHMTSRRWDRNRTNRYVPTLFDRKQDFLSK